MNQAFFHPTIDAGCIETNASYGAFTVFSRPASETTPPVFDPTGVPVGPDIMQQTVSLGDYPLTGAEIADPASGASTVVPVPEPHTIALAASAAAVAAARLFRRRRVA
jgi:hypothetical protein